MTTEKRITIDPGDIKSVEIECVECRHRIVRPAGTIWIKDIPACPGCGKPWTSHKEVLGILHETVFNIRKLSGSSLHGAKSPFGIRFELADSADEDGAGE